MSQKEQTVTTASRHSPSSLFSLTLPAEVRGKLLAADAVADCAAAEAVLQAHSLLGENWGQLNTGWPGPAPHFLPPQEGKDDLVDGECGSHSEPELPGEPEMERELCTLASILENSAGLPLCL